jgi:TP901 family phage tail tape measure protein
MARTLDLGIVLFARDQASGPVRKVKLQVDGLTNSQGRQAKAAATSAAAINKNFIPALRGLAFAAAGAAAAIIKVALDTGEYEREIRLAAFLTGETAPEAFKKLDRSLRDLGIRFGIVPIEVAKATQAVGRLGIRGKDALEVTTGALTLMAASAGELGAQGAVDTLAAAMRSFGIDASKTSTVVDQLANATINTALDFKRLGLALGTAAGFAANFGGTLDETLTLLGLTRDVIVRAERGATGVRNIFKDLANVTKGLKGAAAGLNIETVDQAGNFRNIIDVAKEVFAEMDKMTDAQRSLLLNTRFSVEAVGVFTALQERMRTGTTDATGAMKEGIDTLIAMNEKIRDTKGTGDEFVEITLFGMAGAARIAKSTWEDLKIEFGRAINEVMVPALRLVTDGLSFFTGILNKVGPTGRKIIGILALLGVIAGLVSIPIIALSLAVGSWSVIAGIAAVATTALGVALRFLLSPLGLVIALLSLAVALAVELANLFGADVKNPLDTIEDTEQQAKVTRTVDQALALATGETAKFATGGIEAAGSKLEDADVEDTSDIAKTLAQFAGTGQGQAPDRADGDGMPVPQQTIIIELDKREVGRAVVEFMREEQVRNFESRPDFK